MSGFIETIPIDILSFAIGKQIKIVLGSPNGRNLFCVDKSDYKIVFYPRSLMCNFDHMKFAIIMKNLVELECSSNQHYNFVEYNDEDIVVAYYVDTSYRILGFRCVSLIYHWKNRFDIEHLPTKYLLYKIELLEDIKVDCEL